LINQGWLELALARTGKLLRRYPKSASLHNIHGIVSTELQRPSEAVASFRRAIKLQPAFVEAHENLVRVCFQTGDHRGAIGSLRKLRDLLPESADMHYNLALTLQACGELKAAIVSYREALALDPDLVDAHNNLGFALFKTNEPAAALECYRNAIKHKPDFAEAYNNMGVVLHDTGVLKAALKCFRQALDLNPRLIDAHNHSGNVLTDLGDLAAARRCFQQALRLDSNFVDAYWNLAGTADNLEQALQWLERCLEIDPDHVNASLMLAGLKVALGQPGELQALKQSRIAEHHFLRSFEWVFGRPQMPELYFNRWAFFDAVAQHSISSRPFYEFGVWRGQSFRYLIKTFKQGYGFDTFSGLPEDWHERQQGSYSSQGEIPTIAEGEFVAGEFEQTLPEFFAKDRPVAALINFDADLYTSTLCALEHAQAVIDGQTILVFDEFIMNEHWEQDEFRALTEFCQKYHLNYEVLAVCFFSKQVAVKLL